MHPRTRSRAATTSARLILGRLIKSLTGLLVSFRFSAVLSSLDQPPSSPLAKPVRQGKLIPQLRSPQILPHMLQPLLQRQQRTRTRPGVGQSDITPHAVPAHSQTPPLLPPPSTNHLNLRTLPEP